MPNETTIQQLNEFCAEARQAENSLRKIPFIRRAEFLEAVAESLLSHRADIVPLAMQESRLPEARLNGELDRTAFQFKNFAGMLRQDNFAATIITQALPDRTPIPRPRLELFHVPLGTVAVFGASNFPLAFSVAGGDTASAIAAGCPVVVMAHPAHPNLSEFIANLILKVVEEKHFPVGTFACAFGGPQVGQALVNHSAVKAVGFTGSQRVGRILMDLAASRPEPIPVFAEMGSINPVFMLPGALADRAVALGTSYAGSLTMGVGQFCTNPGVVFGIEGEGWQNFQTQLISDLKAASTGSMLTDAIGSNYVNQATTLSSSAEVLVEVSEAGQPGLARVSSAEFRENHLLREEVFGPFGLLVSCESEEDMLASIPSEGQLTGTIHCEKSDAEFARSLVEKLEPKVGRLVFNGYPTGVEVCESMQHGGPYPASSDARFTSVGNGAIKRWLRPVAYQSTPDWL